MSQHSALHMISHEWLNLSFKIGINGFAQSQYEFQRPNGAGNPLGTMTTVDVFTDEINSDLILTASRNLNENFTIRALVGWNVNQRTSKVRSLDGSTYVIFDIDELTNLNDITPNPNTAYTRRRLFGFYGDVNFGYKDWAFLTLTGRNDWSSTLPVAEQEFLLSGCQRICNSERSAEYVFRIF